MTPPQRIGLLGFGEVGQIIGEELAASGSDLFAFDLKFSDPDSQPSYSANSSPHITAVETAELLGVTCEMIFSAVTAEQTRMAATSVRNAIKPGTWFIDLNSASPAAKLNAANEVKESGGRYVEVAVMSPFPTKRLATPLLLGGPHAREFQHLAASMGWSATDAFSEIYGPASAAKMCRSVMVKGIEALLVESLVTARSFGVEKTVLSSLDDLFPGPDWSALARYMIGRALEHGGRRAEEMREVAKTVQEADIEPHMSRATVSVQDWAKRYPQIQDLQDLDMVLDALCDAPRQQTTRATS